MYSKEDVTWLDGFLKGLVVADSNADFLCYCALEVELLSDDISVSFMDFINGQDEVHDIGISSPKLQLSNPEEVKSWEDILSKELRRLSGMSPKKKSRIESEIFDMVDAICECHGNNNVVTFDATMGRYSGIYVFCDIGGNKYLVLSFMIATQDALVTASSPPAIQ